jgi:hypothetical protein
MAWGRAASAWGDGGREHRAWRRLPPLRGRQILEAMITPSATLFVRNPPGTPASFPPTSGLILRQG